MGESGYEYVLFNTTHTQLLWTDLGSLQYIETGYSWQNSFLWATNKCTYRVVHHSITIQYNNHRLSDRFHIYQPN